ncbi:hypothetical protein ACKKBG_A23905 [Auxenochlorella protothecoides x Auxenochlorella symbiontica]
MDPESPSLPKRPRFLGDRSKLDQLLDQLAEARPPRAWRLEPLSSADVREAAAFCDWDICPSSQPSEAPQESPRPVVETSDEEWMASPLGEQLCRAGSGRGRRDVPDTTFGEAATPEPVARVHGGRDLFTAVQSNPGLDEAGADRVHHAADAGHAAPGSSGHPELPGHLPQVACSSADAQERRRAEVVHESASNPDGKPSYAEADPPLQGHAGPPAVQGPDPAIPASKTGVTGLPASAEQGRGAASGMPGRTAQRLPADYLPSTLASLSSIAEPLLEWQSRVLDEPGVLNSGRNMVLAVPALVDKGLVLDIILLRALHRTPRPGRLAVLVLPCKASCMARAANLRGALTGSEINTLECWNSKHVASILKATSGLVTATVDKAHELFSALLKQHPKASLAYQVSCVAVEDVDLCRQIGDGKSLETMLTLLRYNQHCSAVMEEELAAAKTVLLQASGDEATPGIEPHNQHHAADSYLHPAARFHHAQQHTADPVSTPTSSNDYLPGSSSLQLVLMTASTTDCEVLGRWLEAATPPVDAPCAPQRHLLKRVNADNQSWLWEHFQGSSTTHMTRLRKLSCEETLAGMTKDNVPEFCQSYLDRGKTVIVYCDTRESPEACAHEIARFVRDPWAGSLGEACAELEGTHQGHGSPGRESRQSVAAKLRELGRRSSQVLAALVVQGFAYYHAGLPAQERGLVEAAVTHGLISVLITTAASIHSISWAADVSIFRLASVGKGSSQERSSCAKAHRLLHSVRGAQGRECILTSASSVADSDLMGLLAADNAEVSSCLASEGNMRQALLVSIGRQFTCTALDVKTYVGCTLMSVLHGPVAAAAAAQAALCWLVKDAKLASWSEKTARYTLTRLGSTALEANLHPCQAGLLQRELGAARESLILTSQLHIAYLCVPLDWSIQPNWQALHQFMISARDSEARTAGAVGLSQRYITDRLMVGGGSQGMPVQEGWSSLQPRARTSYRYFAALQLRDMAAGEEDEVVGQRYGVKSLATVRRLRKEAIGHATSASSFAQGMGWIDLAVLLKQFKV